jgi:hypothetical protein
MIIAILPIALIADAFENSNNIIPVSLLKLLRLAAFWPIFRMFKYFGKKAMSLFRIIQAIFFYYFFVHFFGCMFIHISTFEADYDPE